MISSVLKKRSIVLLAAIVVLLTACNPLLTVQGLRSGTANSDTVAEAVADATIDLTNGAVDTVGELRASNQKLAFIQLEVTPTMAESDHLVLWLHAFEQTAPAQVHALQSGWTAATLDRNALPQRRGSPIDIRATAAGGWVALDINSLVDGAGPMGLALTSMGASFYSVESDSAPHIVAMGLPTQPPVSQPPTGDAIVARAETQPVPHGGDAADDPAIWIDPADRSRSTIIGSDKLGGIGVYDLDGEQLHYYDIGRVNNVDLRSGFPLSGRTISLVAGSERDSDDVLFFEVDPVTRGLLPVGSFSSNLGVSGLCMHRSSTGVFSVFVSDSSGNIEQWHIAASGSTVSGTRVRQIDLASATEGCVADDAHDMLYVAEEDTGIWRYPTTATATAAPVLMARTTNNGGTDLHADVEGLAIWAGPSGSGYLIASSQGNDSFVVYDRKAPNGQVGVFTIESGSIDGVSHTDGIDVTSANLGGAYGQGLFVAQDDDNGSANQNFKLVAWSDVAASVIGTQSAAPPSTDPPATDPPATDPPATDPPATDPPATDPPATDPPATDPPATDPPATDPPATEPNGATYYVHGSNGSDNAAGTSANAPWRSLDHAVGNLQAGDTLLLARGQTWDERLDLTASGVADNPIVLDAYGSGAAPVVTGSSSCIRLTGDYLVARNLHATECSWAGFRVAGDHNRIEDSRTSNNVTGISVKDTASYTTILRNEIIDNNVMSVNDPGGSGDSGAFGVLLHGDHSDVGYNTISGSDAFSYDYGRDGAAIEIYGGSYNHIHHNVAAQNDAFAELGEPGTAGNRFDHNVVTSSLETSVFLVTRGADSSRGPVIDTIVQNNSVLLTGADSQGFVCHGGCAENILTLENNVIEAQAKAGYADGPFVGGNNVYFGGSTQFTLRPTDLVADPQWVSRASFDLHLQPASPAAGRGAYS